MVAKWFAATALIVSLPAGSCDDETPKGQVTLGEPTVVFVPDEPAQITWDHEPPTITVRTLYPRVYGVPGGREHNAAVECAARRAGR